MKKKPKIYVGCALTYATEEFKQGIEEFKNSLRPYAEVLDFVGLVKGTPQEVYEYDTKCVTECDVFIADCTYPAIGLGAELGIALTLNKPIIALAQKDEKITRYVLGVTNPNYQLYRYTDLKDASQFVISKLKNFSLTFF